MNEANKPTISFIGLPITNTHIIKAIVLNTIWLIFFTFETRIKYIDVSMVNNKITAHNSVRIFFGSTTPHLLTLRS